MTTRLPGRPVHVDDNEPVKWSDQDPRMAVMIEINKQRQALARELARIDRLISDAEQADRKRLGR